MKLKNVVSLVLSLALLTGAAGCGQNTGGEIIMGTNAQFEPFEYRGANDSVEGFDVELAKHIAAKLGKKLVIEDVSFQSLFTLLESGKIDFIAAGCSITEERLKSADFSDSYFNAKQMVMVMKDNSTINTQDDLKGKKIGVQIGTTGAEIADDIKNNDNSTEVSEYNAAYLAIIEMQSGKLDAVIIDNEPSKKFASVNDDIVALDLGFDDEYYAIAVSKGNKELLDTINKVIKELKDNGEYDKLIDKYFQ